VIKAGDKAPSVTGRAFDGTSIDLGTPGKRTVLYFYPKASTSG
jgi:peroxiredoxin